MGEDEKEIGVVEKCTGDYQLELGKIVIKVDKNYYRPTEVDLLIGDASLAKKDLNWIPKTNIQQLISEMVSNELKIESSKE
jgi:GDPmannose 4,6-dehydratase